MRALVLIFALPMILFSQNTYHKTPEEIELELDSAEVQYNRAIEMFNPWYTGPLLTPSATMMPVGMGNTQPYLFVTDTYAAYNKERKSISLASNKLNVKGTANVLTGLTPSADFNVGLAGVGNWQNGQSSGGYTDMGATLGLLVSKQTLYAPQVKFTISETFPTGRYKNLTPGKTSVQAIGAGAYSTSFGLAFTKLLFWTTKHPTNVRLFLSYQLSTTVDVKGFNSYGGGYGAQGKVRPGNTFTADFGGEVALTQNWVAALDVVYVASDATKFHGNPGTLADGTPSAVGGPYSDNLSLAPAFEYNWNESIGIIAGAWFSVYGRSSGNFASGILSVSYTFP